MEHRDTGARPAPRQGTLPGVIAAKRAPEDLRRHCIIAGTGRAGTTFLVQLLTRLGLDTGFTEADIRSLGDGVRAGLEKDIRADDAPYIIKDPMLCRDLGDLLAAGNMTIDLALVPVRDMAAAAESRAYVQMLITRVRDKIGKTIPGGLWRVKRACDQEMLLRQHLSELIEVLARYDVPVEFLWYPQLVENPDYLYRKLGRLVRGVSYERFIAAYRMTFRPEWVHHFTSNDI